MPPLEKSIETSVMLQKSFFFLLETWFPFKRCWFDSRFRFLVLGLVLLFARFFVCGHDLLVFQSYCISTGSVTVKFPAKSAWAVVGGAVPF